MRDSICWVEIAEDAGVGLRLVHRQVPFENRKSYILSGEDNSCVNWTLYSSLRPNLLARKILYIPVDLWCYCIERKLMLSLY